MSIDMSQAQNGPWRWLIGAQADTTNQLRYDSTGSLSLHYLPVGGAKVKHDDLLLSAWEMGTYNVGYKRRYKLSGGRAQKVKNPISRVNQGWEKYVPK